MCLVFKKKYVAILFFVISWCEQFFILASNKLTHAVLHDSALIHFIGIICTSFFFAPVYLASIATKYVNGLRLVRCIFI